MPRSRRVIPFQGLPIYQFHLYPPRRGERHEIDLATKEALYRKDLQQCYILQVTRYLLWTIHFRFHTTLSQSYCHLPGPAGKHCDQFIQRLTTLFKCNLNSAQKYLKALSLSCTTQNTFPSPHHLFYSSNVIKDIISSRTKLENRKPPSSPFTITILYFAFLVAIKI